ncbi:MAG: inositol monophosphatase [Acidimicrobiales bacterium]
MTEEDLLSLLADTAGAIAAVLAATTDWGLAGTRPGQHMSDLAADRVAVDALTGAGLGVLSEESGGHHLDRATVVVVDPLDGSTNASRPLSWFATSLCAVDGAGPVAAVVLDLVHGTRYDAARGGGARRDGERIGPTNITDRGHALVGLNGLPSAHLGWAQFRALGAAALDLCAVADGRLDGFVDCTDDGLAQWDYLGGLLVCREAGAVVVDLHGRELVETDHEARRTVVAGATSDLVDALASARRSAGPAVAPPRLTR